MPELNYYITAKAPAETSRLQRMAIAAVGCVPPGNAPEALSKVLAISIWFPPAPQQRNLRLAAKGDSSSLTYGPLEIARTNNYADRVVCYEHGKNCYRNNTQPES